MRIVHQTGERLIVEAGDPGFARVLVVLSGVSLIAAAIVLFAAPRGWRAESVRCEQIREVVLQTSPGSSRANPKRRVALLLGEQELPLSVGYAPDVSGAAHALVQTLTRFIGASSIKRGA